MILSLFARLWRQPPACLFLRQHPRRSRVVERRVQEFFQGIFAIGQFEMSKRRNKPGGGPYRPYLLCGIRGLLPATSIETRRGSVPGRRLVVTALVNQPVTNVQGFSKAASFI